VTINEKVAAFAAELAAVFPVAFVAALDSVAIFFQH
jgi:hypothetical protein